MFDNENRALELIERAKEVLDLKGGTLCSTDRPQTASEWMAWLLDHVVEDMHYCIQQETSLKWTYRAMRLVEHLEILGITPSSNTRFWSYHPELLDSHPEDHCLEVIGYLLHEEFVCRECVEGEFTGNMEAFWADEPVPLTIEDVLRLSKPPCVSCTPSEGGEGE